MRSQKRLALGILLALIALVVAGFYLTQGSAPPEPQAAPLDLPRPASVSPASPPKAPSVTQALTAALVEARARPPASGPIEAMRPLVRQCFADASEQYPGPHHVTLSFTLGPLGQPEQVVVVESTIADPRVQACFVDAATDVRASGSAVGTARLTQTFRFGAEDGGL